MTDTTTPAHPPDGLGTAGRGLWADVADQVAADGLELDAREHRILADAARTADDLARLEDAMKDSPVMVTGSMGQPVPNRLFDETRKCRALIAQLLRQLDLAAPAEHSAGRGGGAGSRSAQARAAASIRWGTGPTGAGGA